MKSITYIKTNPTIRVLNFRQTTEKNFGTKSFLASEVNRQSSDNSMRKQILIKSLNKKKLSFLINNHEIAVERAKQAKLRCEIFKRYAGDLSAYKNKIKLSESRDLQMNKASIKIQKVVRGYLVRKSLENEIIQLTQKKLNCELTDISNNDNFLLFTFGKKPGQAVIILQRFFRKWLFVKKIKRIKQTYLKLLQENDQMLFKAMKHYAQVFISRFLLKQFQEQKIILQKLSIIKERLAILKIKKILHKIKVKIKTVRRRVSKYSRKYKSQFTITKPSSAGLDRNSNMTDYKNEEVMDNIVPDYNNLIEILSADSEDYPQVPKELSKKYISYNISTKKNLRFLPLFMENDPDTRPQTTKSTTVRMNLSNPVRIPPKPLKPNLIVKEITKVKSYKIYQPDEIPPYMKDTKSSANRGLQSPSPEPVVTRKLKKNKILCPTFSFTQRTKSSDAQIFSRNPFQSPKSSTPKSTANKKTRVHNKFRAQVIFYNKK